MSGSVVFPELAGWTIQVSERSAGVFEVEAIHESGGSIGSVGTDPDAVIDQVRREAGRVRNDDLRLAEARSALEGAGLPQSSWAVGEPVDDRPCLMVKDGIWAAAYFERGHRSDEFTEVVDDAEAVARFIEWVRAIVDSTDASVAATEEWLRRNGQSRP